METDLEILKQKYGTWQGVADRLQITYRRLCQIRAGSKPGKSLETLISLYAQRIREMD